MAEYVGPLTGSGLVRTVEGPLGQAQMAPVESAAELVMPGARWREIGASKWA